MGNEGAAVAADAVAAVLAQVHARGGTAATASARELKFGG